MRVLIFDESFPEYLSSCDNCSCTEFPEEIVKIMEETHTYSLCDLNVFITDGYMFVKFVSTPEITALQTKVHKLLTAILMSSRGSMTVEKTNSLYTKRKIDST